VEIPYYQIGQFCSIIYFSYFFILIHIFTYFENYLSINSKNILSGIVLNKSLYSNLNVGTEFYKYTIGVPSVDDFSEVPPQI